MKSIFLIPIVIVVLMLSSCSSDSETTVEETKGVSTVSAENNATLPSVQNSFAWKYMSAVTNYSKDRNRNIAISPLSMIYALGMTANGAVGQTLTEITSALGYDGSLNALNYYCKQAMERMQTANDSASVNIANSIEVNNKFIKKLNGNYTATVEDAYDALVETRNFSASDFKSDVNAWCSQQTDGMIPTIIDDNSENSVLIILNALCFRGIWHNKFDTELTTEAYFYPPSGSSIKAAYMNQTEEFDYEKTTDYEILSMDYGNGDYSMQFILPAAEKSLSSVINMLSEKTWSDVVNNLEKTEIKVFLPRFTIDFSSENLSEILQNLGIVSMFSEKADFSNLTTEADLCVTQVTQKAHIEVDEDGTRAAGITKIEIDESTGEENKITTFYADHPFLFVLTEKATGTILFVGQYTGQE